MTFTYNVDTPDDIAKVRYYIRDTKEALAWYQDEEITMSITFEGSVEDASVALMEGILRDILTQPKDVNQDWLRISWGDNAKELAKAIGTLKRKLGKGITLSTGVSNAYRADSLAKESPDYDS